MSGQFGGCTVVSGASVSTSAVSSGINLTNGLVTGFECLLLVSTKLHGKYKLSFCMLKNMTFTFRAFGRRFCL